MTEKGANLAPGHGVTLVEPPSDGQLVKQELWREHMVAWRAFFCKVPASGWTIHQADLRRCIYPVDQTEELACHYAKLLIDW